MTNPDTVNLETLAESLAPGDVLANLTTQDIPCSVPFITASAGSLEKETGFLAPAIDQPNFDSLVAACGSDERLVVVADNDAQPLIDRLTAASVRFRWVQLTTECAADSFMDEEDSDAVAERLRQLGYI